MQYSIDRTKDQVANLRDLIVTLQDLSTVTDRAPYQTYDRTGRRGYYEVEVIVTEEPIPNSEHKTIILTETGKTPIRHHGSQHGLFRGVQDAIVKLRGMKIDRITREIEQRERYIAWQERRIREWKPCPLQPVKDTA